MNEIVLIYTTWPDAETAEAFAAEAVAEGLCACVNVLAPLRSIYRWEGAVERATETPALFKAAASGAEALKTRILDRHPYDTPCVIALPVSREGSHEAFLAWVASAGR